jgi:hypothetical protein
MKEPGNVGKEKEKKTKMVEIGKCGKGYVEVGERLSTRNGDSPEQ